MLNLSSLLEKFKKLKNPKETKENLSRIFSKCLGFEVDSGSIELREKIVYINLSGYIKTEIFIKKEMILDCLTKEGFGEIKDIR